MPLSNYSPPLYQLSYRGQELLLISKMRNNNSTTYALDNDTGEFKKGDIELTVIRVNGEHIGENPMEAERKNCLK